MGEDNENNLSFVSQIKGSSFNMREREKILRLQNRQRSVSSSGLTVGYRTIHKILRTYDIILLCNLNVELEGR